MIQVIYITKFGFFEEGTVEFKACLEAVKIGISKIYISSDGDRYRMYRHPKRTNKLIQIQVNAPKTKSRVELFAKTNDTANTNLIHIDTNGYRSKRTFAFKTFLNVMNLSIDGAKVQINGKDVTMLSSNYKFFNIWDTYQMTRREIAKEMNGCIRSLRDGSKAYIFNYWKTYYEQNLKPSLSIGVLSQNKMPFEIENGIVFSNQNDDITITPTVYEWKQDEVFVNFAAKDLGGGVLRRGWVQEEFLTTCLTLLPFVSTLSKIYNNLDNVPALIRTHAIFEPNLKYYGSTNLIKYAEEIKRSPDKVFVANYGDVVKRIYWLSMAAVNISGGGDVGGISVDYISQMLNVAIKAFYLAYSTMILENSGGDIVINTGNWGAGAFGWNARASFLIQYYAFKIVKATSFPSTPIKLHYHAFDKNTQRIIENIKWDFFSLATFDNLAQTILEYIEIYGGV